LPFFFFVEQFTWASNMTLLNTEGYLQASCCSDYQYIYFTNCFLFSCSSASLH